MVFHFISHFTILITSSSITGNLLSDRITKLVLSHGAVLSPSTVSVFLRVVVWSARKLNCLCTIISKLARLSSSQNRSCKRHSKTYDVAENWLIRRKPSVWKILTLLLNYYFSNKWKTLTSSISEERSALYITR